MQQQWTTLSPAFAYTTSVTHVSSIDIDNIFCEKKFLTYKHNHYHKEKNYLPWKNRVNVVDEKATVEEKKTKGRIMFVVEQYFILCTKYVKNIVM